MYCQVYCHVPVGQGAGDRQDRVETLEEDSVEEDLAEGDAPNK